MCFTQTSTEPGSSFGPFTWPPNGAKYQLLDILTHNAIANCSVMYRRAFKTIPDWVQELKFCDIPLHSLHALQKPIGYIPELMAVHRINKDGNFDNKPLTERLEKSIGVYDALAHNLPPPYRWKAYQFLTLVHLELTLAQKSPGHLRGAIQSLRSMPMSYRAGEVGLLLRTMRRFAFNHYGRPK